MKLIFVVILLIYQVQSKKESLKDFEDLFKDPDLMFELKKRLGSILENTDVDGLNGVDSLGTSAPAVDCYALSGTLEGDCSFHSNESTIIKTTESLERGAIFLKEISNVSCARDCTLECCGNEDCDTSVYQDKLDNNCYLFKCDHPSLCVFAKHSDYWMSSMSKEVHSTHQYTPGGATPTHENELENLGSHPTQPSTSPTPPTTVQTTTPKPGLGEYCASYEVDCEDPHAECLMKKCKCHVGYHQKHGVCRKRCIQDEFECDEISYRPNPVQCISALSLCDGRRDCDDASDEANCPTESEKDDHRMPDQSKPYVGQDSKDGMKTDLKLSPPHVDVPDMKSDTSQDKVTDKPTNQQVKVTTPSVTTSKVLQPVTEYQSASKPIEGENNKPVSDNNDKADLQEVKPNLDVNQPDTEDSKNSNTSSELTNENESEDSNGYNFLNVDSVQVESFTDSSQGPVVALALGLAITMMLLILVGCRLRTVKRRLRKGRALHSNEADYLINGMYL